MRRDRLRLLRIVLLLCGFAGAGAARADYGEKLRRMLATKDFQERNRLYTELRQEVKPADLKTLADALEASEENGCGWYLVHLLEVADAKGALPVYRRALGHRVTLIRTYAAQALGRQGDLAWADGFLATIADPAAPSADRLVLVDAFSALQDIPLLTRLVALIRSSRKATPPDPQADALGHRIISTFSYRKWKEFLADYREALAEGGPQSRSAAAVALMRLGDASGLRVLREEYAAGRTTDEAMLATLSSFYNLSGPAVAELLRAVLERSKLPALTIRAVQLLGDAGDRRAAGLLQELAGDPDAAIAEAALTALAKLASEDLLPFWRERLAHESAQERIRAAAALVVLDDYAGVAVLAATLRDRSAEAALRLQAANALARAVAREAVAPLLDGLEDPDAGVRGATWTALGKVLTALFPYRPPQLEDAGYDPKAAPGTQQQAIDALRAFWARRGK